MSWRNGEGYPDPTAEIALGNLIWEEKRKKKRNGGEKYAGTEHCMYSRDLSEKRKSADRVRMKKGYYIGAFALFGYHKDPDDKHKLIVDEEAADIVRRIFSLKIEGNTTGNIASILNADCFS